MRQGPLTQCQHFLATWEDTQETVQEGDDADGSPPGKYTLEHAQKVEAYEAGWQVRTVETKARTERLCDAGLSDAERQGLHSDPTGTLYNKTIGEEIRLKLQVHADRNYDPHLDAQPTGAHTLCIRTIEEGADARQTRVASLNDHTGACVRTLQPKRLLHLYRRFMQTDEGSPPDLPAALAQVVATHIGTGSAPKGRLHRPPTVLRQELHTVFGCTKEQYSDALTVLPSTIEYWSAHAPDAPFGARMDAHSILWTGASMSIPPATPQAAQRAVRWSLH
jgi:hypothetical protein